ncbi:unnamed protein product, partial [Laminaria digitata]
PPFLPPTVKFVFGSSKPLSRFMCMVDGGRWRECEEKSSFPLSDGRHSLSVVAVDPTGRSDPWREHHEWEV